MATKKINVPIRLSGEFDQLFLIYSNDRYCEGGGEFMSWAKIYALRGISPQHGTGLAPINTKITFLFLQKKTPFLSK